MKNIFQVMLSRSNTLKSSAGQTEHSSQKTMNIIGESVLEAFCLQLYECIMGWMKNKNLHLSITQT